MPMGLVRNASTSNRLSLLTKVKDSTSAIGFAPRDRQAHKMITATFLHGEIDGAAIGCPLRRTLAIVNDVSTADFAAIAAVAVHDPDVRVFHGGFAVGEATARAQIGNGFTVRRPPRIVFAILGSG